MIDIKFIILDLFCGAGGTTTGFENVPGCAVVACVNHDENAIKSHEANHPYAEHFTEDITEMYGMVWKGILFQSPQLIHLIRLINIYRAFYPNAKVIIWASLECTNFSKAKGGQPRDADSRTLANHMDRYYLPIEPEYLMFENVVEFMAWGPLDENGKPISRKNGISWLHWRKHINECGYKDEWKELNSADFGAYTSRNRLFGICAKEGNPIIWPETTHEKVNPKRKNNKTTPSLFSTPSKKPWKAVKEVLDLSDIGKSILNRKKPLSDKTLEVISSGLIKSIESGENPFIFKYYGNGDNINPISTPLGTITTKDRFAIIFRQYKTGFTSSINEPIGALPTNPKANLVTFIMNKSHGGHTTSINQPCPVIVARQDKAPLYLINAIMNKYGIEDITMRMLKVPELLKIQGFPDTYKLIGNQSEQKKFIGNSVHPIVPDHMANALLIELTYHLKAA